MRRIPLALLALAACSSSTSKTGPDPTPDAPGSTPTDGAGPRPDAALPDAALPDAMLPAATVVAVTCPASVPLTVDAPDSGMRYVLTPSTGKLSVGGVAKFTMHQDHNVIPSRTSAMTDPGLRVNFNETKCLMFTRAGTFTFECSPHGFEATIVVQ